jgi:hypothetical protein
MKTMKYLKVGLCSVLLAAAMYSILSAPGFLPDEASVVPIDQRIATVRP